MSTKIFGGYRLPSSIDVPSLARALSERALPVRRELALTAVGVAALLLVGDAPAVLQMGEETGDARLASVADGLSFGQVKVEDLPFASRQSARERALAPLLQAAELVDVIQEKLATPYARRVPVVMDLLLGVSFMSDPAGGEWTYAILYTDREAFRDLWEQTPGVEAWPYWNNSDRPDDVSEAAWDERRDTWNRVLGNRSPAEVGIAWELRQSDLLWQARASRRVDTDAWLTATAAAEAAARLVGTDKPAMDVAAMARRFAEPRHNSRAGVSRSRDALGNPDPHPTEPLPRRDRGRAMGAADRPAAGKGRA